LAKLFRLDELRPKFLGMGESLRVWAWHEQNVCCTFGILLPAFLLGAILGGSAERYAKSLCKLN